MMPDRCSYVCPQIWLNSVRTNKGPSPATSFLNENGSLSYFAIMRELLSCLSLTVVDFAIIFLAISRLFQGTRKDKLCNTLMF